MKYHGVIRWNGTEGMWVRDQSDQQELAATTYKNQPLLVLLRSLACIRSGDEETSRAGGASDVRSRRSSQVLPKEERAVIIMVVVIITLSTSNTS